MTTTELNLNQTFYPLNTELSAFNDNIIVDENGAVLIDPTIIEDSQNRYYTVLIDNAINSLCSIFDNLSKYGMTEEEFYQKLYYYEELRKFLNGEGIDDLTAFADLTAFDDLTAFGLDYSEQEKSSDLNKKSVDEDDYKYYKAAVDEIKLEMALGKKIHSEHDKLEKIKEKTIEIFNLNKGKYASLEKGECCDALNEYKNQKTIVRHLLIKAFSADGFADGYSGKSTTLDALKRAFSEYKKDGNHTKWLEAHWGAINAADDVSRDLVSVLENDVKIVDSDFDALHRECHTNEEWVGITYHDLDGTEDKVYGHNGGYLSNPPNPKENDSDVQKFIKWTPDYTKTPIQSEKFPHSDTYMGVDVYGTWEVRGIVEIYLKDGMESEKFYTTEKTRWIECSTDPDSPDYYEFVLERLEDDAIAMAKSLRKIKREGYGLFEKEYVNGDHIKLVFVKNAIEIVLKDDDGSIVLEKICYEGDTLPCPEGYDIEDNYTCSKTVQGTGQGINIVKGFTDECILFEEPYALSSLDNAIHYIYPSYRYGIDITHRRDVFDLSSHYPVTKNEEYTRIKCKNWICPREIGLNDFPGGSLDVDEVYEHYKDAYPEHTLDKEKLRESINAVNRRLNRFLEEKTYSWQFEFDLCYKCPEPTSLKLSYTFDENVEESYKAIIENFHYRITHDMWGQGLFFSQEYELSADAVNAFRTLSDEYTYSNYLIEHSWSELTYNDKTYSAGVRYSQPLSNIREQIENIGEVRFWVEEGEPWTEDGHSSKTIYDYEQWDTIVSANGAILSSSEHKYYHHALIDLPGTSPKEVIDEETGESILLDWKWKDMSTGILYTPGDSFYPPVHDGSGLNASRGSILDKIDSEHASVPLSVIEWNDGPVAITNFVVDFE